MRQQSRIALPCLIFAVALSAASSPGQQITVPPQIPPQYPTQPAGKPFAVEMTAEPCLANGTHQYANKKTCSIRVNRTVPGSPLPVTVPKGTTVQIYVDGRLPLETIQFVQTLDSVAAPDFGLALVKAFSPGISAITIRGGGKLGVPLTNFEKDQQADVAKTLVADQKTLSDVAAELANFKDGDYAFADARCSPKATYDCAKTALAADADEAAKLTPPASTVQYLDSDITARINACAALPTSLPKPKDATDNDSQTPEQRAEEQRQFCLTLAQGLQERQTTIHTALLEVQDKITATSALSKALKTLPGGGVFIARITGDVNKKATVKITAKDVSSGTSTDIATVTITWQGTNFSLSSGILLSTLPNRTYANSPIIINGLPVLDNSGKVTTEVTESDTRPSIVTPLALFNYEVTRKNYAGGKFGVLVSGGLGANLTTKSADYALGLSFRYREALFSPMLHYGRETFLSNGVTVGQKLGSSPPTLPTEQNFKPAFGLAITYRIPIP